MYCHYYQKIICINLPVTLNFGACVDTQNVAHRESWKQDVLTVFICWHLPSLIQTLGSYECCHRWRGGLHCPSQFASPPASDTSSYQLKWLFTIVDLMYLKVISLKAVPVFLTQHHAMNAYWRNGGIAPHIIELGTRWRWVVSFTFRRLYPQGKSSLYSLDRRLFGPQSRSGRGGGKKNSQLLPGPEPPIILSAAHRYTTEISRLLLKGDLEI
jgi:hypothetical protein